MLSVELLVPSIQDTNLFLKRLEITGSDNLNRVLLKKSLTDSFCIWS